MIRSILHGMNLKSRSQRKCSRRWRDRPLGGLEYLEGRVLLSGNPTIYTVNLTTDSGPTSAGEGTGDAGDLRYVINLANADPNADGTLIEFDPTVFATAQTITLTQTLGPLALSDTAGPETIEGPGADQATVSGNGAVGVFSVASGVTATISGLTIDSGSTATNGGGIDNSGLLTLSNDTLSNNTAAGSGGGIENEVTGTLSDFGSTYTNNTAGINGGAIDNEGSIVTLTGDTFDSNTAGASGGGIYNEFSASSPNILVVTQTTLTNNSAGANGGAIDNGSTNTLTLTSDTFDSNTAAFGGAIESEVQGSVTVTQSTLTNNTATGDGGVIDNQGGSIEMTSSTIVGNTAIGNGGVVNNGAFGDISITDSILSDNTAADGGAVFNETGGAAIIDSTIVRNAAAGSGGGLANELSGNLTISGTTIANNSAALGGGILNDSSSVTVASSTLSNNSATNGGGIFNAGTAMLTTSTVAGNTAATDGGGIFDQGPATLTLEACTVSGNTAAIGGGGGLYNAAPGAQATLTDTIIAGNVELDGTPDDITGSDDVDVTGTFNLIGPGGSGGIIDGQDGNIVLASISGLGLAPLGDYGGPTETIALLPGSAAIGVGTGLNILTDQRGFPIASPPDIGAFQTQTGPLVVNTTEDGSSLAPGDLSLRQAVNLANLLSVDAVISFDTTVFSTATTITLTEGALELSNTQTPEIIDGSAASSLTINGNNAASVFVIDPGVTASLMYLTIAGGSADLGGGIANSGSLALANSTIVNNTASSSGGGIYSDGSLTIVNSTIDDNTASSKGGGAFIDGGTLTVVNSTIVDNIVPGGSGSGAGLYVNSGTGTLNNTIVALNIDVFSTSTTSDDIAGTSLSPSSGFNLIGTGGAGGLVNGTNGNIVGVANPKLGVLASNGGPTQTIALLPGSPAIDAGSVALAVDPNSMTTLTFDQRGPGFPRTLNDLMMKVDIGAFEHTGSVTPPTPTTYTVDRTSASGAGSGVAGDLVYVISQADADPNPGGSVIIFDPTVFATTQTIVVTSTLVLSPPAGPIVIDGPDAGVIISGNGLVGIIQVARDATAAITGVTISDGLAAASGGGIVNNLAADLTLTNDVFMNNAAAYFGGAIYNNGGMLTIVNSMFANNSAVIGLGGAIDNTGTLNVTDSTFTGGNAFQGGAIDNRSGSLAVVNSTFTSNIAIMGGAIFNNAIATVYGSTIANNVASSSSSGTTTTPTISASFDGGAIANDHAGVLTITNSTLAFNAAGQAGGAIDTVGVLTAVNDTIAYNTVAAGGSGGGIYASSGTTTLNNTIVVLNTSGTGRTATASDISGNVARTSAFNLIGTGGAGGLTEGTNGNQVGVASPGLDTTLAANVPAGAPIPPTLTLALLAGSPAIDAGSNALAVDANGTPLVADQRGNVLEFPRIVNSIVDIGAFERPLATTTTLTSSLNPSVVGNEVTFTVTVSPSNSSSLIPTGSVTFYNGTIALANGTKLLVNGTATYTTSSLPLGASQISVVYVPDAASSFATSTSNTLTQTVNNQISTPSSVAQALTATAGPVAVNVIVPSVAFTSIAAVPQGGPVAAVKKGAAPKKAHPKGGSSTKFHQSKHTATLKHSVHVLTKHANVKAKKK